MNFLWRSNIDNSRDKIESVVEQLVTEVKTQTGERRTNGFRALWNLAEREEYKLPLTNPKYGLIPFVIELIGVETGSTLRNMLGMLWYLSRAIPNREYFGRKEVGLVTILMAFNTNDHIYKNFSFLIFVNICLHPATHDYLLSDEVGFLAYYRQRLVDQPNDLAPYRLFGNLMNVVQDSHIDQVLKFRIHGVLMGRLLSAGPNPSLWEGNGGGIEYWCVNAILGISSVRKGVQALKELRVAEYLHAVIQLAVEKIDAVKACCILANLYGSEDMDSGDEQSSRKICLLERYPSFATSLVDIFTATLSCNKGEEAKRLRAEGYTFGIITLSILTNVLKNLAVHPKNQEILISHPAFLANIRTTLLLFIQNAPELSTFYDYKVFAGGGGEDYQTITNCLELLLHLQSAELSAQGISRKVEYWRNTGETVQMLIDLPPERNVPLLARYCANEILQLNATL